MCRHIIIAGHLRLLSDAYCGERRKLEARTTKWGSINSVFGGG